MRGDMSVSGDQSGAEARSTQVELAVDRQVRRLRRFYRHLALLVVLGGGLALVNLVVSPGRWWFVWPLAALGVSAIWRGLAVLGHGAWLGAEWEQRKRRELLAGKG